MPFKENILWASGRRIGTTRLIVKIETDEGVVGWGESICLIDTVLAVFDKVVAPLAKGYAVCDVEKFTRHILGAGYYHHKRAAVMASSAMEMAMWDAYGRMLQQPLHKLWGGAWRKQIPASAYLFLPEPQAVSDKAKYFMDKGYTSFKAKIGFDAHTDIVVTEAVRTAIGDYELRVDVNGAWTPGTASRMLYKLKDYDLSYVEQPLQLDDLIGHAKLRESQHIPIALDESAYTLEDIVNIVRMEAADVLLLDPQEAGGCWQTIKAAAIAEAVGIPLSLHSGGEMSIAQAAYLHLAASIPNLTISIDTERDYLAGDIVANPLTINDGAYTVPEEPGLGVEPIEEKIEQYQVAEISGAYLDSEKPNWFPVKPSF
nr:mandelate racemase/muconate lactonizing enzyme family protein [Paraglaciecola arctica]